MKISKSQIAVLALLAVTVVYAITLYQSVQAYNSWKTQEFLEWCEMIGVSPDSWYANFAPDYVPFWQTKIGVYCFMTSLGLTLVWFIYLLGFFAKGIKRTVLSLGLTVIITIAVFGTPMVLADDNVYVDVLCVLDEEATGQESHYAQLFDTFWAPYFRDNFQIIFRWYRWYYWNSDDSATHPHSLLMKAISGMEWYWSKTVEGEPMELMIVITGYSQGMSQDGLSYPWERALIVKGTLDIRKVMFHEIGHQFDLSHCGDFWCYMNPNARFQANCYCADCSEKIMANRECLLETPPPPPDSGLVSWFWGGGATGGRRK